MCHVCNSKTVADKRHVTTLFIFFEFGNGRKECSSCVFIILIVVFIDGIATLFKSGLALLNCNNILSLDGRMSYIV